MCVADLSLPIRADFLFLAMAHSGRQLLQGVFVIRRIYL